jgi:hypothetical protein
MGYMRQDYNGASRELELASKEETQNPVVTDQIALQRLLLFVDQLRTITPIDEEKLQAMLEPFDHATTFRRRDAFNRACLKVAALYAATAPHRMKSGVGCASEKGLTINDGNVQHRSAKAFLFKILASAQGDDQPSMTGLDGNDTEDEASGATLDDVIAYFSQSESSAFDRWIWSRSPHALSDFYKLRGTQALRENDFQTAIAAFAHVPDSVWRTDTYGSYLAANPFWTGVIDTHSRVDADTIRYSPPTFARKMLQLQSLATSPDSLTASQANFQLGAGIYNMTWWGNSWLLVRRWWSTEDLPDDLQTDLIKRAKSCFLRAVDLAPSREYAAQCLWMAAKCEQKEFLAYYQRSHDSLSRRTHWSYNSDSLDTVLYLRQRLAYRNMFGRLHAEYNNTHFVDSEATECSYYESFVAGK